MKKPNFSETQIMFPIGTKIELENKHNRDAGLSCVGIVIGYKTETYDGMLENIIQFEDDKAIANYDNSELKLAT